MKIGIFGYGEVGKAIEKLYQNSKEFEIKIKDLKRDDGFEGIEILNVCIPYNEGFVGIVSEEVRRFKPRFTIIHSTIAPGTTLAIKRLIQKESLIVHSPIRGIHPNLYEGIMTFVKYIGGDDEESKIEGKKHLESLGIRAKCLGSSLNTEFGKLLDTTYYGLVIAWHGEVKKLCDENGLNFDEVSTDFNKTYNEGYSKLGKNNVVRPVLFPPENGKIGGHCIIPNARILNKFFDSKALDIIFDYD